MQVLIFWSVLFRLEIWGWHALDCKLYCFEGRRKLHWRMIMMKLYTTCAVCSWKWLWGSAYVRFGGYWLVKTRIWLGFRHSQLEDCKLISGVWIMCFALSSLIWCFPWVNLLSASNNCCQRIESWDRGNWLWMPAINPKSKSKHNARRKTKKCKTPNIQWFDQELICIHVELHCRS